jgi:hypothetical protein
LKTIGHRLVNIQARDPSSGRRTRSAPLIRTGEKDDFSAEIAAQPKISPD